MSHDPRLLIKVEAVNACHAESNRLFPILIAAFAPFVGEKIMLAAGGFTKKFKESWPELPNTPKLSVYISNSGGYNVIANIKTCYTAPNENPRYSDHCYYHPHSLYLAETTNGVLTKLYEKQDGLRTDYTADEVCRLRKDWEEKKRLADAAHSRLLHFGEYDRG
jgi:hypothetical protein